MKKIGRKVLEFWHAICFPSITKIQHDVRMTMLTWMDAMPCSKIYWRRWEWLKSDEAKVEILWETAIFSQQSSDALQVSKWKVKSVTVKIIFPISSVLFCFGVRQDVLEEDLWNEICIFWMNDFSFCKYFNNECHIALIRYCMSCRWWLILQKHDTLFMSDTNSHKLMFCAK